MTFVALLRRDVLSMPFALNKFIQANYNDAARSVAKCQNRSASFRSAFRRQSLAAGHVVGAHPLWRQMQASMVLCPFKIKTTIAKNDLVRSLLGGGQSKREDLIRPMRGDGKRLVTAPPPRSTSRDEQNRVTTTRST